jgi:hypothetical protein
LRPDSQVLDLIVNGALVWTAPDLPQVRLKFGDSAGQPLRHSLSPPYDAEEVLLIYAIATGVAVVLGATPVFARQAQKTNNMDGDQL